MQHVFRAFGDDRVAGVISALAADHDIGPLGQIIDDFSFAFIAPLEAYNNGVHEIFLTANERESI